MRRSLFALAALLALASPAFADEVSDAKAAIAAANLSEESDLLMWCGAAFTIASAAAPDDATKKSADDIASVLFGKAAPLLTADGVADADLSTFGTNYTIVVKYQIVDQKEEAEHTQEECTAAAKA
jgi:nucleoside-specific outer membrane channel protein Tsx